MAEAMPLDNKAPAMDPMVAKPMESDLLKTIVSTETGENTQAILGDAPELDVSLLQEVAPQKSVMLLFLKILFGFLVFASLASAAFFTSQLTNNFDFFTNRFKLPNVSADLASTNAEIIGLQTDLNLSRFQQTKAALDKFSYDGDQFLQVYNVANSQTSSSKEKQKAKDEMEKAKTALKDSFLAARDKLSKNFVAPLIDTNFAEDSELQTLYEDKLRAAINGQMTGLMNSTDAKTKMTYRNYQQTLKLIGNIELKNLLIQTDFAALKDKDLYDLIKKLNSLIVNDMSVIQTIKNKRIKWSDVIDEIDKRTMAVDSHFNDDDADYYQNAGGVRYNSYDFDSETGKISIIGETKSLKTTFTIIADLIDELNESKFFQNAEMRSFSKSGTIEEGYLATLRLTFDLKQEDSNKK